MLFVFTVVLMVVRMYAFMHAYRHVCIDLCMHVCTYVCMYVCILFLEPARVQAYLTYSTDMQLSRVKHPHGSMIAPEKQMLGQPAHRPHGVPDMVDMMCQPHLGSIA